MPRSCRLRGEPSSRRACCRRSNATLEPPKGRSRSLRSTSRASSSNSDGPMENPFNFELAAPYLEAVAFVQDPVLEALAAAISGELSALNHLRFKFEVQQMVLFGNRGVWIEETTADLEL